MNSTTYVNNNSSNSNNNNHAKSSNKAKASAVKGSNKKNATKNEFGHYVVTAHAPGSVLLTCKCNFLGSDTLDLLIAKPRRIEVRQLQQQPPQQDYATPISSVDKNVEERSSLLVSAGSDGHSKAQKTPPEIHTFDSSAVPPLSSYDTLPIALQLNNVHGNLVAMEPLVGMRSYWATVMTPVFVLQERLRYAVLQYNPNAMPYPVTTHASGSLAVGGGGSDPSTSTSSLPSTHIHSVAHLLGRTAETGPIVAVDPECRCIVLHLYDGLLTVLPINPNYVPVATAAPTVAATAGRKHDDTSSTNSASNTTVKNNRHGANHSTGAPSSILGEPFHCRIEERTILALTFLRSQNPAIAASSVPFASAASAKPHPKQPLKNMPAMPLVCLLHQDSRGVQHVTSHLINLRKRQLHLYQSPSAPENTPWLKKSAIDGGSAIIISVPPPSPPLTSRASAPTAASTNSTTSATSGSSTTSTYAFSTSHALMPPPPTAPSSWNGGILVLGQRQFTYCSPGNSTNATKIVPVPHAMYLSYDRLPDDPMTGSPRYLIGDEFGNLHMLSILFSLPSSSSASVTNTSAPPRVVALQLETLGSCAISSSMAYLDHGLCFIGSAMGDSQLVQIHDEPISIMPSGTHTATTTNDDNQTYQSNEASAPMNLVVEEDSNRDIPNERKSDVPEDVLVDLMDTTYLTVVEEYTNLGPILDFDLVPTTPGPSRGTQTTTPTTATGSSDPHHQSLSLETTDVMNSTASLPAGASSILIESQQHQQPQHHVRHPHQQQQYQQSQVVTASGSSKSGTIRVIRNGIGMKEYASVEMAGIQSMWSIRKSFHDRFDTYLVQSFVGETRVLGVTVPTLAIKSSSLSVSQECNDGDMAIDTVMLHNDDDDPINDDENIHENCAEMEEAGGTLEEVLLPGLEPSASSLYVGNVQCGDRLLQITESEVLLISTAATITSDASYQVSAGVTNLYDDRTGGGVLLDTWSGDITVAAANEAGQIIVAMAGGQLVYLSVTNGNKISKICEKQMDREVSCINLNPFVPSNALLETSTPSVTSTTAADIDDRPDLHEYESSFSSRIDDKYQRGAFRSTMVAVGLWDDFTVRLLSLDQKLEELVCLHLSSSEEDEDTDDNDNATSNKGMAKDDEDDNTMDTTTSSAPRGNGTTIMNVSTNNQRRNRNNMMARSICLITLDCSSAVSSSLSSTIPASGSQYYSPVSAVARVGSNRNPGVNMLFVGLGDGTLLSFAVVESMGIVSVHSRKEVCLGTQCINLVPLHYSFLPDQHTPYQQYQLPSHHQRYQQQLRYNNHLGGGGTCVLATGDRPTVIYLTGVGGSLHSNLNSTHNINPKLCYSNVNVAAGDGEDEMGIQRPSSHQAVAVNVATPFYSPHLFGGTGTGVGSHQQYSLCVADETSLRLGVIDDIQKLHVTTCRLGMSPRRVVHCQDGRLFAVGCIESGIKQFGYGNYGDESNMGNCIRFMDDTTFDDLDRVDLEPYEMVLSMIYATMKVPMTSTDAAVALATVDGTGLKGGSNPSSWNVFKPFLFIGTAYALPDEDEPSRGRILIYSCRASDETTAGTDTTTGRVVRQVAEFFTEGGVYSMSQFFDGLLLATVNSKTHVCCLVHEESAGGFLKLQFVGNGHFGHILSLFVKSRAKPTQLSIDAPMGASIDLATSPNDVGGEVGSSISPERQDEMIAIVGDLMRSISLVQYYPQHQTLEEIARDFNVNWTTAIEMLTDKIYLGAENWNNLFCLRRNPASASEEIRCRLDTIGEFHLGEMCNKFMSGSLVMPVSTSSTSANPSSRRNRSSTPSKRIDNFSTSTKKLGGVSSSVRARRPIVVTGSQTLFGTASGSLGVILGMDARTTAFFSSLERAMANPKVIRPIGDFLHSQYRACHAERRIHPAHGFVDGDLVESFLDLDRGTMERVVTEMNRDGGWELDDDSALRRHNGQGHNDDKEIGGMGEADDRTELTVDDVLAMVEEISMLH